MSSPEVVLLRMMLAEDTPAIIPNNNPQPGQLFSDDQLTALINYAPTLNRAAQIGWTVKASYMQMLVDVDESGVVRKLSQMYKQAVSQAEAFKVIADEEDTQITAAMRTVGVAGYPWGHNVDYGPASFNSRTYLIGDISRAGIVGAIEFIEIPVYPDAIVPNQGDQLPIITSGRILVPTERPWHLSAESGRTFDFQMDYQDSTGVPVDLTGWSAVMTVQSDGDILLTADSLTTGGLTIDNDNCRFVVHLMPTVTSAFDFDNGDYEVVATAPSGDVYTLVAGDFQVTYP